MCVPLRRRQGFVRVEYRVPTTRTFPTRGILPLDKKKKIFSRETFHRLLRVVPWRGCVRFERIDVDPPLPNSISATPLVIVTEYARGRACVDANPRVLECITEFPLVVRLHTFGYQS